MSHLRTWVRTGIVLVGVGYAASLTALFARGEPAPSEFLPEFAVLGISTCAFLLVQRNRTRLAGVLTLAGMWIEVHVAAAREGNLLFAGTPVLPALVVGVGLFLGGPAGIIVAAVTAFTYPAAVWLGSEVWHTAPGLGTDDVHRCVVLGFALVGAGTMTHLALKAFAQALRTAQSNERKFSLLVNGAPNGIVLLDGEGRVESLNPAAERILSMAGSDARGRRLADILKPLAQEDGAAWTIGHPVGAAIPTELSLRYGNGRRATIEVTTSDMAGADGPRGTLVMLHDATARRDMEARAAQLGRMIDQSPSEIYVFDQRSLGLRLVSRGARTNLRLSNEDVRELTVTDVNPALTSSRVQALATELASSAEGFVSFRTLHQRRDGTVYPVELQLKTGNFENEPVIVAFALDISSRVAAENDQASLQAQLQHAQKMEAVGQLAGGVAHDFNNLLMAIGGYAEMLQILTEDTRVHEWAGKIRRAQERGAALTKRLLAFARKEIVQPKVLTLTRVVTELKPILYQMLGERRELRLEAKGDDTIVADHSQVEQVIVNLVSNAKDATPDGGMVTVAISGPDASAPAVPAESTPFVSLEVRDNGVGMDESTRRRMFDPFYTTKPKGSGTGLGLSTVHSIVTGSGGYVEVESKRGHGTTVRVNWPATERREEEAVEPQAHARLESLGPHNVLVVEDEDATRDVIEMILTRAGYLVLSAGSAEEGLESLERADQTVDLVITDIVLPGLSGFEFAQRLRSQQPDVKVLFMSGYLHDAAPDVPGFDMTADLLLKPFTISELVQRVAERLA